MRLEGARRGWQQGWHVYAVEWRENRLDFFVDGELYLTRHNGTGANRTALLPADPMFLIFDQAVDGWLFPPGPHSPYGPNGVVLEVDYVRLYVAGAAAITAAGAQPSNAALVTAPNVTPLYPWQNSSVSEGERLADLVSRLTLAEKATQLHHQAPPIERIGLPGYSYSGNCNHGEAGPAKQPHVATVFPQSLALAESWDLDGIRAVGRATANEARADYNAGLRPGMHSWGPNVNVR